MREKPPILKDIAAAALLRREVFVLIEQCFATDDDMPLIGLE